MAVEFLVRNINIPSGTGRRQFNDAVTFAGTVIRANVAINGFKLDFATDDHHINIVEIDTDVVNVSGTKVDFRAECQYADKNADDAYSGYIQVLVIADTTAPSTPA
jgi:hypothetical protein